MSGRIEITIGDVSDVEAHVFARYRDATALSANDPPCERMRIRGTLRGPLCETSQTLPAEIPFRDLGPTELGAAQAIVPDPCTWSPELPHLYQVDVEARRGEHIVAEYHGQLGLKRSKARRGGMAFPG